MPNDAHLYVQMALELPELPHNAMVSNSIQIALNDTDLSLVECRPLLMIQGFRGFYP